jgi:simple sugar transport system ATP-binding protein
MGEAVTLDNISKSFGETVANDGVDLSVTKGEIHTLLGENGAGKTTLMKILYGHFQPDSGDISVGGTERTFDSPRDAIDAGVGMVHQHFMIVENMTVAENIFLGKESTGTANVFLDEADEREQVREMSEQYQFDIDPNAVVENVSVGVQQRVEILKTLTRGAEVIILDEPTAVLTPQEVDELFEILRTLTDEGKTIILITHKLNEAVEVSDAITVLRDGKNIDTVDPEGTTKADLAEMMVGREVLLDVEKDDREAGESVLDLSGVTVAETDNVDQVSDVSFEVRKGEIFGIVGVDGNGQTELIEAITGLRGVSDGSVRLLEQDITGWSRRDRIEAGMAYIPEDRETKGLVTEFDLNENGLLGNQYSGSFSGRIRILWNRVRPHVKRLVDEYDVRPGNTDDTAGSLSGGNKQKFIVGRELETDPTLLIAAQPTRGVDIGSIEFIQDRLLEIRQKGKAVLLMSSKLDEAMQLSDRLAVMYDGELIDIVDPSAQSEEAVGLLMAGESLPEQEKASH